MPCTLYSLGLSFGEQQRCPLEESYRTAISSWRSRSCLTHIAPLLRKITPESIYK